MQVVRLCEQSKRKAEEVYASVRKVHSLLPPGWASEPVMEHIIVSRHITRMNESPVQCARQGDLLYNANVLSSTHGSCLTCHALCREVQPFCQRVCSASQTVAAVVVFKGPWSSLDESLSSPKF